MVNYNLEFFRKIKCPICGRIIRVENLPKVRDDLEKVAIDHNDHIAVIKYDKYGFIRTIETYSTSKHINKEKVNIMEKCPKCKETIPIIYNKEYPTEIVYKHTDHAIIVYMFEEDFYITEVYPMIKFDNAEKIEINAFEKLLKELDEKSFAIILALIAMKFNKKLMVPRNILDNTRLLSEHYGVTNVQISEGDILNLEDKYYEFFLTLIRSYGKNPLKLERKYRATLSLIEKTIHLLREVIIGKNLSKHQQELITNLDQIGIWEIIKYRLMNEFSPESIISSM